MPPPHAQAAEPMAVGEQLMQLDQAITLTLQEIDENFSKAHEVVTARVLPAIKTYEESCARTWLGARFWKQFFEASAQVSLSQQPLEDADASLPAGARADAPPSPAPPFPDASHVTRDSDQLQSPPRPTDSAYARDDAAPMPTPFERLKRDVGRSRTSDELLPADLSLSMVNDPSRAVLPPVPTSSSPAKGAARTPRMRRRSSVRPHVSILAADSTVPVNPFAEESLRVWDGIADLRKTPLGKPKAHANTARAGHEDDDTDTSLALPHGMSPPVTMQFSVPQSKYLQSPAKEAARMVVGDLLRSVGDGEPDASAAAPSSPAARRSMDAPGAAIPTAPFARSPSVRRPSIVGTPLARRSSGRARRSSLPTPPTITKVHTQPCDATPPPDDEPLDDMDASAHVAHIPGMLDRMLTIEMRPPGVDAAASDSDAEDVPRSTEGHSESRSIQDDTLFGLRGGTGAAEERGDT
ncbi:hypothetical protein MSPP1_003469 [Malassezia sp. CBS 17886]|nr:hypothetical protein MSPP1_003469 [Malassezia sp. CBS 17886]